MSLPATCVARAPCIASAAFSAPIVTASFPASAIAAAISSTRSTPSTSIAIATATFGAISTLLTRLPAVASTRHMPRADVHGGEGEPSTARPSHLVLQPQ